MDIPSSPYESLLYAMQTCCEECRAVNGHSSTKPYESWQNPSHKDFVRKCQWRVANPKKHCEDKLRTSVCFFWGGGLPAGGCICRDPRPEPAFAASISLPSNNLQAQKGSSYDSSFGDPACFTKQRISGFSDSPSRGRHLFCQGFGQGDRVWTAATAALKD